MSIVPIPAESNNEEIANANNTAKKWRMLRGVFTPKDQRKYLLLIITLCAGAALEAVGIGMIPAVIGLLATPEKKDWFGLSVSLPDKIQSFSPQVLFLLGAAILLVLLGVKTLYFTWMYRKQYRLIARHRAELSSMLFQSYMKAPWPFHLKHNSAELLRNAVVETSEIMQGIILPGLRLILGMLMGSAQLVLLVLFLPWRIVLVFFMVGLCSAYCMRYLKKILTKAGKEAKTERRRSLQTVNEGLSMVVEARILQIENFLVERFAKSIKNFSQADRKRFESNAIFPYIMELLTATGVVVILGMLIQEDGSLGKALPQISLVGIVAIRLRQTLSMIFSSLGQMHFSKMAIHHVCTHLKELTKEPDANKIHQAPFGFSREITFTDVSFNYENSKVKTIDKLNLSIKKGDSVAIVGPSGSGKSTVVQLLLGLLIPTKGDIHIDGKSIINALPGWQKLIGYVPQSIQLIDDSIRRNVALGVPDNEIEETRINEVIKLSQLESTMVQLDKGLDTLVGERGVRLSGGQRQRLGIARALYHKPSILVVDEGTSALDAATEANLVGCLRTLEGKVTMLFVAHRLATITHCNQIFFLKDGKLLAKGTHEKLIQQLEAYRSMHNLKRTTAS
ncbi:ABC transporter ATP-binding protein/permease [Verrucomicrobia bacterium]|nr:ABC transporter ATP-binding protein/permease [Verrucomicrobiota bacterium]